jgi:tetratricopeptide (TPR) repeat protein
MKSSVCPTLVIALLAIAVAAAAQPNGTERMGKTSGAPVKTTGPARLYSGLGQVDFKVSTRSPRAQKYFDQGLAFDYGFNHDQAELSFIEAARLDPRMAMAYWGQALVLGPNYNIPGDQERGKRAWTAITRAESLASAVTPLEHDLIGALKQRYGPDGNATPARDQAYEAAMRAVAHRYPDDPDVQVLFAEALMDLDPWRLWTADGKPAPGTPEILGTLEQVLRSHPDHIGADHYYIHALEASTEPCRALASAERLADLAPGAGHLVHMPSHIYLRMGRYHDAAETNRHAIAADRNFFRLSHDNGLYPQVYYPHNFQFLAYAAMMEGRKTLAIRSAREVVKHVSLELMREIPAAEFFLPLPYYAEARFADWDAILTDRAPPADLTYTIGIWHYARGLAMAARGRFTAAAREQSRLDAIIAAMPQQREIGDNNRGRDVLGVASATLTGQTAAYRGDHPAAVRDLTEAVRLQDALSYEEPPIWYFPVREALGRELIACGRPGTAEAVYREDLKRNPANPRSLDGLARALRAAGKPGEAEAVDREFRRQWRYAEIATPAESESARAESH